VHIRITALLLAIILACTGAFAQQSQTAFTFTPQVWTNATIGGYAFDSNTKIDTIALSDSGALAFTSHRENGGTGRDQTAVATKERLVATEGQIIDGKEIIRIATAVLGINNAGRVAFEALYAEPGHNELHGGIFLEGKFVTEFEPSPKGLATPFVVADDGMIRLSSGIIPAKPANGFWRDSIKYSIDRVKGAVYNHLFRGNPYGDIFGQTSESVEGTVWARITKPAGSKRSQVAPVSDARSCPAPSFPYPAEWTTLGATSSGPVAAKLFEQGTPSRSYDSPTNGHFTSPFRQIQFNKNCEPLTITVADKTGRMETRTPRGLLTYAKDDGTLELPGFFQRAVAGSFVTSDVAFEINQRGQIAIRIAVADGFAVLLATPVAK
jgi:hypothetical protein